MTISTDIKEQQTAKNGNGVEKHHLVNTKGTPAHAREHDSVDTWYYPPDIVGDLDGIDLPTRVKEEVLVCAWEYTRCVIPQYTNWDRYVAFMRTIVIGTIAEFRGELVDVTNDHVLGYNLNEVLDTLFEGTPGCADMHREFRAFCLVTAEKSSQRRNGELFRHFVNALAYTPRQWYRIRDCDALGRFTIAAALACNDIYDVYFSDEEFLMLSEIGNTMYDAVAFFKHRTEGEVINTFAYMPEDMRIDAFRQSRETLWALDVAWARKPELMGAINFVRIFAGPIHMMMRRYRFVEEDLTIGRRETEEIIEKTRGNFKLWNRMDARTAAVKDTSRFERLLAREEELMFPGLADMLRSTGEGTCQTCRYRSSYGAEEPHRFGGVEICSPCSDKWRTYLASSKERAISVFPELQLNHLLASKDENRESSRISNGTKRKIDQSSDFNHDKSAKTYKTRNGGFKNINQESSVLSGLKQAVSNKARIGRDSY